MRKLFPHAPNPAQKAPQTGETGTSNRDRERGRSPGRGSRRTAGAAHGTVHLPVLRPHAAGIDAGATHMYVAPPPDRAGGQPVEVFETFTEDLQRLARWLGALNVDTVVVESTGVYWVPLFQILETHGIEVCLVNPKHVKNVRGRKTDMVDAQWLQYLHSVGLLEKSYRPADQICVVRSIIRHRASLVADAGKQTQRMQKALAQMNILIHHVLSDLTGVSGMRILTAIVAGERDPEKLAALRDGKVKADLATILKALHGDWRAEHLFVLRQALQTYQFLQGQIQQCDVEVEQLLRKLDGQADPEDVPPAPKNAHSGKPRKNQMQFRDTDVRTELFRLFGTDLTQQEGLGPATVLSLYAELGADLSAFPTAKRFASWLGLCPNPKITGGRTIRHRRRDVQHRVAAIFRLAAQSLHSRRSDLGDFLRAMQARLGKAEGITAMAHKLARIFYRLVTSKEPYDPSRLAHQNAARQKRKLKRLQEVANGLGYTLTPNPAAPAKAVVS